MSTIAFVPVKADSERIRDKNRAAFDGELLFVRKLKQLLATPGIDEVCLDTESDEIAALASHLPVRRIVRPKALASNATDGHELFAWECSQAPDATLYIQALCTAPFIGPDTLSRALAELAAAPDADSLVAVRRRKDYVWRDGAPPYGGGRVPNSIDLPHTVTEGMSLYMVRRPAGGPPPTRRFGTSPVLFDLDAHEDVDINTPADLVFARTVAAGLRAEQARDLAFLANFLSTPLISDVCKDLGLAAELPRDLRMLTGRPVIGSARTLSLREIGPDEPADTWRGIYDSLDLYDVTVGGDILVIGTETPGKAFFGDLNGSLARRAGAIGAIIDGATRDVAAVEGLGLTVFARQAYYDDIRFHGTMRAIGGPVRLGDALVSPDDILIGDADGVAWVPRRHWAQVRAAAVEGARRELRVRAAALSGMAGRDILRQVGDF